MKSIKTVTTHIGKLSVSHERSRIRDGLKDNATVKRWLRELEAQRQTGYQVSERRAVFRRVSYAGISGLWRFKVRRFRIIYEPDRKARLIRIFAVGHRREIYEKLADRLRRAAAKK